MPLPPGYYLVRADPEVLVLRRAAGELVARFNASGYVGEAVEQEAWKDHRRLFGELPPTYLAGRE